MRRVFVLLFCAFVVTPTHLARADAPPPHQPRPVWDDPPAPLPVPPEEAWRRLTSIALLALTVGAVLALGLGSDGRPPDRARRAVK